MAVPMICIVLQKRLAVFPIRAETVEFVDQLGREGSRATAMALVSPVLNVRKVRDWCLHVVLFFC